MRSTTLFAFVFLISLAPKPATAAKVEARERAAKKACLTGDATKGVELLADLYIDTNDETYIYNQGRCFEQNNRYEDAIGKFREYLRKASKANVADKLDAEKHIADCQALLGKKEAEPVTPVQPAAGTVETPKDAKAVEPTPPTETPKPDPALEAKPRTDDPVAIVSDQPKPADTASGGSGLRVAGIVVAATGVAAIGAGIAMNLKHNSMIDGLQKDYEPDRDSSAKTYRTLGWVGYGAGAACLLGGALLYYLGWKAGGVTVAPAPVAGLGGALVVGGAL